MSNLIVVGMADMQTANNGETLVTYGLGSCVGICLYDAMTRVGGMAHIMLPSRSMIEDRNLAKYADTAIPELFRRMCVIGARKVGVVAKIAGGAHMFCGTTNTDVIKVGQRNVEKTLELLRKLGIPIRAEDTAGTYGRTILLDTANGSLLIKTIGHGEKQL